MKNNLTNHRKLCHAGGIEIKERPRPPVQSGPERGFVVLLGNYVPDLLRIVRCVGVPLNVDTGRALLFRAHKQQYRNQGGSTMFINPAIHAMQGQIDTLRDRVDRMLSILEWHQDVINTIDNQQPFTSKTRSKKIKTPIAPLRVVKTERRVLNEK